MIDGHPVVEVALTPEKCVGMRARRVRRGVMRLMTAWCVVLCDLVDGVRAGVGGEEEEEVVEGTMDAGEKVRQ